MHTLLSLQIAIFWKVKTACCTQLHHTPPTEKVLGRRTLKNFQKLRSRKSAKIRQKAARNLKRSPKRSSKASNTHPQTRPSPQKHPVKECPKPTKTQRKTSEDISKKTKPLKTCEKSAKNTCALFAQKLLNTLKHD